MPIISDRPAVKALISQLTAKSPSLTLVQAAETALRSFYNLTPSDGIFNGSEAAICLGFIDQVPEEDLFARIVDDLVEEMQSS